MLFTGYQYVNKQSQDFRYYYDRKFQTDSFFQSDQKMRQKYCLADLSSVLEPLTCSLPISVLIRGFFAI